MSATEARPRVAWFGLGTMGVGMARRLLAAGFPLVVYNRSREKAEALVREGAETASTPREAATGASVAIAMVADDEASRATWLGEAGALAGLADRTVIVEASTLTVDWVRELSTAAADRGIQLLDAPVTGSRPQAASGELNFLVGGLASALDRVRPVLAPMARSITHAGPTGSGALLKLVNNFLCAVQAVSTGEALALIERSGLNREQCIEVLSNGAPASPILKTMFARMTTADYVPPYFRMALMAKDMRYAIQQGVAHAVPLTTATTALESLDRAIAAGHGDEDFSAVVEPLRRSDAASSEGRT